MIIEHFSWWPRKKTIAWFSQNLAKISQNIPNFFDRGEVQKSICLTTADRQIQRRGLPWGGANLRVMGMLFIFWFLKIAGCIYPATVDTQFWILVKMWSLPCCGALGISFYHLKQKSVFDLFFSNHPNFFVPKKNLGNLLDACLWFPQLWEAPYSDLEAELAESGAEIYVSAVCEIRTRTLQMAFWLGGGGIMSVILDTRYMHNNPK